MRNLKMCYQNLLRNFRLNFALGKSKECNSVWLRKWTNGHRDLNYCWVFSHSVFQLYLVNFKWLKFIPPTANSCYLGQNISWGQKIFQKFWFLDIPMSCQSFLKNHLVKWPFSVAIWSGKRKFNFLYFLNFKLYFC